MNDKGLPRDPSDLLSAKENAAADDIPASDLPGLPAVWNPVLGMFWLWFGLIFMKNAADFGYGFFPAIVWFIAFPIVTMFYVFMTVEKFWIHKQGGFGSRFRRWRMAFWVFAAFVYGVVGGLHLLVAIGVCSSCGDALDFIVDHSLP